MGALIVIASSSGHNWPPAIVSGLFGSVTTIIVGWWVNVAIRRRAALERVPLDYVAGINRQIDKLLFDCLSGHLRETHSTPHLLYSVPTIPSEMLVSLRQLGNTIHWLRTLLESHRRNFHSVLQDKLLDSYVEFKTHLTDTHNIKLAQHASNEIRLAALKLHHCYCDSILDRPVV